MNNNFDQIFPTINKISNSGTFRNKPEDFIVTEINNMEFSDSGEHWWLYVEKINSNTAWVATQIASACKVPARQVGYAGLKDRHAITRQWFSVQLPKIKDLSVVQAKLPDEINIIKSNWHQSKLKTGHLNHNQFNLIIRDFEGDQNQIEKNITQIKQHGVPNYFGPQRFGHGMGNIQMTEQWFTGKIKVNNKNQRSLLISTARSHIFNSITAHRINTGQWNEVIPGDLMQLNRSHSWFPSSDANSDELRQRLKVFDIHITAALWGEDEVQSALDCAELETAIGKQFSIYQMGFEKFRVKQDRRALRIQPLDLSHQLAGKKLTIQFSLLPGSYATTVMRELMHLHNAQLT